MLTFALVLILFFLFVFLVVLLMLILRSTRKRKHNKNDILNNNNERLHVKLSIFKNTYAEFDYETNDGARKNNDLST